MFVFRNCVGLAALMIVGLAQADPTYKIKDFVSSGTQNGDRDFVSTGFVGSSTTFDTSSIGNFQDGTLSITSANGGTYGWTDDVPRDTAVGQNAYALNPDRGDATTAYGGEANKTAKLSEVFGQSNLGYLMDGEEGTLWTLDLLYGAGKFITATGSADPELLVLERGANSKLGVRAVLEGGQYSSSFVLDFHTNQQAALADYTLNTLEIDNAQNVGGIGVSLEAFGLSTGTKILGYQFFADSALNYQGPDFIGFVASKTTPTSPVPEPASMLILAAGSAYILKRKRSK